MIRETAFKIARKQVEIHDRETEKALDDFEEFLITELGAILDGGIELNDRSNMLQRENLITHFNLVRKKLRLRVR